MVQQILEVVRLMGGDEQRAFIVDAAADDTFQGLAGGDVQPVCRFVEQDVWSMQGKGVCQHCLLLLSVGDGREFLFPVDFQLFQVQLEFFLIEMWIEYGMACSEAGNAFGRHLQLFGQEEVTGQPFGLSLCRVSSVYAALSVFGKE